MSGAILSDCDVYRYLLWRDVDGGTPGTVGFLMLNPSTADASKDDPTIRKCIGFARRWGFAQLQVANLFAYRATNPKELPGVIDPVGPDNNAYLRDFGARCDRIICAWGADKFAAWRVRNVLPLLPAEKLYALRVTKTPWHPLYLPYSLIPQPWSAA